MYGLEWLIMWGLLGAAAGAVAGVALAGRRSKTAVDRTRELEAQLESARAELTQYRQEAVAQFTETARKFQTLNNAYIDLHQQLARSSSILCGDISGPLLEAPLGHQSALASDPKSNREPDMETAPDRENVADPEVVRDAAEMTAGPEAAPPEASPAPLAPDSERLPASRSADGAKRED